MKLGDVVSTQDTGGLSLSHRALVVELGAYAEVVEQVVRLLEVFRIGHGVREARDARDIQRSVSPLKPAEGAFLLDNSALTIEASVAQVLQAWEERRPFDRPQV